MGSVPFSYWLGRWSGVTLTALGTGNPGAANLYRQSSRALGVLAGALDMTKGALAVLAGQWLGLPAGVSLLPGAAAIAGHWHSPILGFSGGAGLATVIGVGLGAAPVAGAVGLAVGVTYTAIWHNVGRAGVFGWSTFFAVAVWRGEPWPVTLGVIGLGFVVLLRALLRDRLKTG